MLDNFNEIKVENPADKIIRQIRSLVTSGQIQPGDRLPPERKLAEKFGVGRSHVRDAIRKLEFYGIVKTVPQSGTFIAGMGINALEGLLSNVLEIAEIDFASLVETRVILEINGAASAALRRTDDDLIELKNALNAYEEKVLSNQTAVEEDLFFHLKIAEVSKNSVLNSLMLIITPDIMKSFVQLNVCNDAPADKLIKEHRQILQYISDKDAEGAKKAMQNHLRDVLEFSQQQRQ